MKRRIISAAVVLLLLIVLALPVLALEEPDMNRTGTISITMTHNGTPVGGGSLTLLRVADVHEENGADYSFRLNEAFAPSEISLEDLASSDTASALALYAAEQKLTGTKQAIDRDGNVVFEDLQLGLYLLIQEDAPKGYALSNPFLVSVPGRQDDRYVYEVDASPKLGLETVPTEPPTEPSTPPNLPQTGQLQWPVPALAVMGVLLVAVGVYMCAAQKRRCHEK